MADQPGTSITMGTSADGPRVCPSTVSEPSTRRRTHATPYWETAKLPGTVERRQG